MQSYFVSLKIITKCPNKIAKNLIKIKLILFVIFRWHYFKYKNKLTPEQLWKAKTLSEYKRSVYYGAEQPIGPQRDTRVTTFNL